MTSIGAIHTGPNTHFDHLVPLCFLLGVPLIITEKEHQILGQRFYPMVDIQYVPLDSLTLEYMATHFDVLITCGKFWALELKPLFKMLFQKEMRFIFAPHGNSDKEKKLDFPIEQDIDLVYGPQMKRLKKGENVLEMGNIRLWFYQKFKEHFDAFALGGFSETKKNVLYAPTWSTKASQSSFFEHVEEIISSLSRKYHLIIKLHPLLEENSPAQYHYLLGKYEQRIKFLIDFPAIYPLLEKTDIYLGDTSSIGYDFLTYDRSMFFLNITGELAKCGVVFEGTLEGEQKELSPVRKKTYQEAFGKGCDPEKLKALLYEKIEPSKSYSESSDSSTTTAT